ncbi:NusG domain II-containing protein [candidate division KSB1 bacterium]|nr:NusG domain II-containing protein [candidate division KSB1 bacterium]
MHSWIHSIWDRLTPADRIVILLPLALGLFFVLQDLRAPRSDRARVTAEGQAELLIDLSVDSSYRVSGPLGMTELRVADGRVSIVASPCRQQLCVAAGEIWRQGQLLVCAPNRILVRIPGSSANPYDGVTE